MILAEYICNMQIIIAYMSFSEEIYMKPSMSSEVVNKRECFIPQPMKSV